MKKTALLIAGALFPASAMAQPVVNQVVESLPAPPTQGKALPGQVSRAQDKFVDVGNVAAKDLAARKGITVGEATRDLRLAHAAGNAGANLAKEDPETFGGVTFEGGAIKVFVKRGGAPSDVAGKVRRTMDQDLRGAVEIVQVKYSRNELRTRGRMLAEELGEVEGVVGYRMSVADSTLSILSTTPGSTRAVVQSKIGELPEDVIIEQSEPLVATQDGYGGTGANTGVSTGCPTFGFVVAEVSNSNLRA